MRLMLKKLTKTGTVILMASLMVFTLVPKADFAQSEFMSMFSGTDNYEHRPPKGETGRPPMGEFGERPEHPGMNGRPPMGMNQENMQTGHPMDNSENRPPMEGDKPGQMQGSNQEMVPDMNTEMPRGQQIEITDDDVSSYTVSTILNDYDDLSYPIVDTNQLVAFNEMGTPIDPNSSDDLYGQDANYEGYQPDYSNNGDGTVTDLVTGLMWTQDPGEKMGLSEAMELADDLEMAGYDDWRLPTIKELYSLIQFSGTDPDANSTVENGLIPFIDTDIFNFEYGDTENGERIIDSQFASSTIYESTTMFGSETVFGVNFADGRIKGYPVNDRREGTEKQFYVLFVRGNEAYGENDFVDNGDGTITDLATGLMWMQDDSEKAYSWSEALEYAENASEAGYDDWRLPDAKELQSIVDYSRSPATTDSAAIDPVFNASEIIDEGGSTNYPFYWTGTTHISHSRGGKSAVYIAFGEALGFMSDQRTGETTLTDVHGAGAQRSDMKVGDADDYPTGRGPQGDVIRVDHYVRLVRSVEVED